MSTIVALVGPIEYWWNTPDDPARFHSPEAVRYRDWRERLSRFLVDSGRLVFRPHEAFKGPWDERAQVFNDHMVEISDVIVNMRPPGIPGRGTDHELELAESLGKPIIWAPPGCSMTELDFKIRKLEEGYSRFMEVVNGDLI